jgi:hypothetical protein
MGVFERIGKIDNFVETALELYDPRLRQHEAQHQAGGDAILIDFVSIQAGADL